MDTETKIAYAVIFVAAFLGTIVGSYVFGEGVELIERTGFPDYEIINVTEIQVYSDGINIIVSDSGSEYLDPNRLIKEKKAYKIRTSFNRNYHNEILSIQKNYREV